MLARIYRPAKSAMQSGRGNTRRWVLEFEPEEAKEVEPLMGWTSSGDMEQQVRIYFSTKEEAIAYARKHNIPHQVFEDTTPEPIPKTYAENFAFDRVEPWTH
ncbi:MAG: ETC complex I subunit [Alphaproteobacteria bacterium]